MRKIVVATFVSLDGVMQAPGGPLEDPTGGFTFGGWTAPHFDATLGASMGEIFGRPFDLLLGRKTYDIFAAHFPYNTDPNDPIAGLFNRVTKYVATRSHPTLTWQNTQDLGNDVVASLSKLKAADGPDLLVQGSSNFLQTLWQTQPDRRIQCAGLPGDPRQGQTPVRRWCGACRPEADQVTGLSNRRDRGELSARRCGEDGRLPACRTERGRTRPPPQPHLSPAFLSRPMLAWPGASFRRAAISRSQGAA